MNTIITLNGRPSRAQGLQEGWRTSLRMSLTAATLNNRSVWGPHLNVITRLRAHDGKLAFFTITLEPVRPYSVASASVLNASLTRYGTDLITGFVPLLKANALAPTRSAFSIIATTGANHTAHPAVIAVHRNINANSFTRRPLRTGQRQAHIFAHLIRRLVEKFRPKLSHPVHSFEINGFGLLHRIPRYRDGVRSFLPGRHKWPIANHAGGIRQRPAHDVVDAVRIGEHGRERDGFTGRDLRDIRLQTEEHGRPRRRHRGGSDACIIGTGVARLPRVGRRRVPGWVARRHIAARIAHGLRHRCLSRHGHRWRTIVPARQENRRDKSELLTRVHALSLPRDADACNQGA